MTGSRLFGTLIAWQDEGVLRRLWRLTEPLRNYFNFKWELGNFVFSISTLTFGLLVLVGAFVVSRYLRRFIESRMAHHKHLDPGVQFTILRLVHYVIVAVGVMAALRVAVAADFTSLAVVFTALSVGIGFGLQFIAGDIASGFIILFERPVKVGDFVTITGPDSKLTEGRVRSINLRSTVVMTNDNVASIVPNSKLVNQTFLNWSYRERRSRISVPVGVSYDSDPELVKQTLLRAAEGVQFVLDEPKPSVQFLEFADSDLRFRLLVWTDRPRRYPAIKSEINYRIHRLFREAGIEIPFPQRDLHLRGGSLRLDAESHLLAAGDGGRQDEEGRADLREQ
ncbi:MAG TPA: mechanosensitive ion channel domain-containing protein [Pyrinomonadaceae bacterium]|nr:mechanosensitive ion channel domain-containing protein [Pyrinomonadaceae bacterium]